MSFDQLTKDDDFICLSIFNKDYECKPIYLRYASKRKLPQNRTEIRGILTEYNTLFINYIGQSIECQIENRFMDQQIIITENFALIAPPYEKVMEEVKIALKLKSFKDSNIKLRHDFHYFKKYQ